jgi:hypothetical protein
MLWAWKQEDIDIHLVSNDFNRFWWVECWSIFYILSQPCSLSNIEPPAMLCWQTVTYNTPAQINQFNQCTFPNLLLPNRNISSLLSFFLILTKKFMKWIIRHESSNNRTLQYLYNKMFLHYCLPPQNAKTTNSSRQKQINLQAVIHSPMERLTIDFHIVLKRHHSSVKSSWHWDLKGIKVDDEWFWCLELVWNDSGYGRRALDYSGEVVC